MDSADWQLAIEDANRFINQWGGQAEALEWTDTDLFDLHQPPDKPGANYRRLSRLDQTGLIWFVRGRTVVALTASEAVIGAVLGRAQLQIRALVTATPFTV